MDLNARLIKTAKGEEEIKHRTDHVGRNERFALILVDGHSTVNEVLDKASGAAHVPASIQALVDGGYIQAIAPQETGGYAAMKQALVAIAWDVFGDKAGKVVAKIEAAPENFSGLKDGVAAGRKIAQLILDEEKAKAYVLRCHALLMSG